MFLTTRYGVWHHYGKTKSRAKGEAAPNRRCARGRRRVAAVLEEDEPDPVVLAIEIKFLCPACDSKLRTDVRMAGRRTHCTVCGHPLTVPSPAAAGAGKGVREDGDRPSMGTAGEPSVAGVLSAHEVAFLTGPSQV